MGATARMCARCATITERLVLVAAVHQGNGPGFDVHACADCAPAFPPAPDVLDLFSGRRGEGEAR
ncbi:hypothetical protein ABGT92_28675 [Streptomyces cinereoruber]|uniref:hypothetical protein n=1 Tax=Streptomyces cinereoruber TaxID=67260 RepID=UPI00345CB3C3